MGYTQDLRRFGDGATEKIAQLDQFGLSRRFQGKLVQNVVNGQYFKGVQGGLRGQLVRINGHKLLSAAMLARLLSPRVLDKNAPHGLGRGSEEMAAMLPLLVRRLADQP
jgi:hypothetical protein